MTAADEKWMKEALAEATAALAEGEIPIGAVIVCRGRIVGKGHNMTERLHDPTAHAEMIAITAATEALGGKYPESPAGELKQVGGIVYGADDPKRGSSLFSPSLFHPRTTVEGGLLADDCRALMLTFFREKR